MSLDHVNSNMKAGLGRRFRSDNLKSGELLTIGIERISFPSIEVTFISVGSNNRNFPDKEKPIWAILEEMPPRKTMNMKKTFNISLLF